MNHKRKRPKSERAGCLMCKPHKANGCCPRHKNMRFGDRRRFEIGRNQMRDWYGSMTIKGELISKSNGVEIFAR